MLDRLRPEFNWHGFGRTRGGWVDAHGRLADPPRPPNPELVHPGVEALLATNGWCAPVEPLYDLFGARAPGVAWSAWIEWRPPFPGLAELLPKINMPRGPITFLPTTDSEGEPWPTSSK